MTRPLPVVPYPPHWEADVIAADGAPFHLRPIVPSDADALVRFHDGLSERSRYLRYFTATPILSPATLHRITHHDFRQRVGMIALLGSEVIAEGRYEGGGDGSAEVAFVVADAHQGRGIGSVLLEHLAAAARECGIKRFTAEVLAANHGMLNVFRDAGYVVHRHLEYGEVSLDFPLDETPTTAAVMREREQRAEARSIERLLWPRSIAVVGATEDANKIGNFVFSNLLRGTFAGIAYPVNARAPHVLSVRAYPSLRQIPDAVDVAVVAVPAAAVADVVAQAAGKGPVRVGGHLQRVRRARYGRRAQGGRAGAA